MYTLQALEYQLLAAWRQCADNHQMFHITMSAELIAAALHCCQEQCISSQNQGWPRATSKTNCFDNLATLALLHPINERCSTLTRASGGSILLRTLSPAIRLVHHECLTCTTQLPASLVPIKLSICVHCSTNQDWLCFSVSSSVASGIS